MERLNIKLREAVPGDEVFLIELFASTRTDELQALGDDENLKQTFIKMQFHARERSYPRVDNRIVLLNGREIGRILVDRGENSILLVDIAILTEYRNAGIGSRLLQDLIEESAASGKPLQLHVLNASPAVRLYERLGFRNAGTDGAYLSMTWTRQESN